MIGLTPLDAVLDAFGAQFCGSLIALLFGSLRGVIVIAGVLVLAYALFTLAFGLEVREALARVLKLGVVVWVFGWMVPTDVQVWMSGGTRGPSSTVPTIRAPGSGNTSGWLNAIVTVLDSVTVELLDLIKGLGGSSTGLTSQRAFVYGLNAVTQATTFDIQDPRMREGVQQFLQICLPRAYEDIAQGKATSFFDWIVNNGTTPIVTASEASISLPGPGTTTFDGLTTCKAMHDVLEQSYVESYARDRGAHFSDPSQAVNQEAIAQSALENAGYTGGEPVAGLAWRRWLTMALNTVRTANGINPLALGAMKATELMTRADLGVLYEPARATGRGEAIAGLTLGVVGWFDRVLDGAFTTKMMAIVLPLVLAVVRCLLYILFPFAWLSLGVSRDGTPFWLWLGAVAWTKAQYVVMTLMVELELFLGRTFQILKEMPFGAFPFESMQRMESTMSLVFAVATVVGMGVTAAIFFRAASPMVAMGRAAAGAVLGSAATIGLLAGRTVGAASGVGGAFGGLGGSAGGSRAAAGGPPGTPPGGGAGGFPSTATTGSGRGPSGGLRVSVTSPAGAGTSSGGSNGTGRLLTGGSPAGLPPASGSSGGPGAAPRGLPPGPVGEPSAGVGASSFGGGGMAMPPHAGSARGTSAAGSHATAAGAAVTASAGASRATVSLCSVSLASGRAGSISNAAVARGASSSTEVPATSSPRQPHPRVIDVQGTTVASSATPRASVVTPPTRSRSE